jgi:branched-subunit amino acid transport protein AzlD
MVNTQLPAAIMLILVGYSLKGTTWTEWPYGAPEFAGIATVAGIHLARRNALLSILLGTAVFMILRAWLSQT